MTSLKSFALCFLAAAAVAAPDAETMKRGAAAYAKGTCIACHQPTGMGIPPVFPPLAGSEWVSKDASIAVRNIVNGMQGPITVKGVTYNSMMPPVAGLTDKDIADVVNYVNHSWGNTGPTVTEAEVTAIKKKYADRKTPWTAAEYEKEAKEAKEAPAKK
jgi:mono/diheme cytochrome c family protein